MDRLDRLELRVCQEVRVSLEQLERLGRREGLESLVGPDSPEHRVPRDSLDLREALDLLERPDLKEIKALLVSLDSKDPGDS